MIRTTIAEIESMLAPSVCGRSGPVDAAAGVAGVSKDTRTLQPGNLYIPLIGERFNGHDYVAEAARMGAAVSLWQRDQGEPPAGVPVLIVENSLRALQQLAAAYRNKLGLRVVAVTGSNGKTTTKDMIAAILKTAFKVAKTEGNLNNHIGLPMTLLGLEADTDVVVVEMGMSGRGEILELTNIASPDAAVITNIGEAHLQQLGSREEIARAKMEVVCGLRKDGLFVYHGDEPLLQQVIEEGMAQREGVCPLDPSVRRVRFGQEAGNDLFPLQTQAADDHSGISFAAGSPERVFFLPLLGRHNVLNAIAAIAVAEAYGVGDERIREALAGLRITGMRMEMTRTPKGLTILNDAYNASPNSMKAALGLLGELQGYGKKIAVLGDMLELGPQAENYHRKIGKSLHPDQVDMVFTFGPLSTYIAEEAAGHYPRGRVYAAGDKDELARAVLSIAHAQDVVLLKASRGMKLEEIADRLMAGG